MKGQLTIFGLLKHEESMGLHSRSDETRIFCSNYILTVVVTAWHFNILKILVYLVLQLFTRSTDIKISHLTQML